MSHLTANPFSKHFEFPRPGPLLTPPDTESEYANPALHPPPAPTPAPLALGIDLGDPLPVSSHRSVPSAATEVPLRKGPNLPYIHSGPREARERVVQRGVRWLVVVIPPTSVVTDRAHFGHTLSVGSTEKLPQGMLMPLFPTMSGQIGAIAREFSFPSTSGICLYLHTSIEGLATMPRISDEAWQMLWAAYFEPRSPTTSMSPGQLPISGRIEFDIDFRKARWYETWLGSGRRDLVDVPVSVTPSRPQSVSHWRGDSRTTFLDDQQDDPNESASMLTLARGGTGRSRHIPRKLSLLDRVEALSLRSGSKLNPRNLSPPSPGPVPRDAVAAATVVAGSILALSPVAQEEEPKSARKDINMLVNSWRQSASLAASPLAATGQTSLDPANMPNDLPLVEDEAAEELNLDDFAWSVSSLGPPSDEGDDDGASLESWRLPSVHMDRRMAGSVCLTPTTQTSWGPQWDSEFDDFDLDDADVEIYWTPDLAARMLEDCPPTPTTATSWGPASYDAASPLSDASFAISIDLAHRGAGSVMLTPTTATSWGPPLEWPPSPAEPFYVRTPDVGQRTFDVDAPREGPWHHVWPYQGHEEHEEEEGKPYEFVYPYYNGSSPSQAEAEASQSGPWKQVWPYRAPSPSPAAVEREGAVQYPFVYPYYDASSSQAAESGPWKQVWPYRAPSPSILEKEGAGPYPFVFPYYSAPSIPDAASEPWHQVWPYRVPGESSSNASPKSALTMVFPWQGKARKLEAEPWKQVWPYHAVTESEDTFVVPSVQHYPYLTLYPAVYPHHDLYPAPAATSVDAISTKEHSVHLEPAYPTVRPYRPGYPHIEPYPPVSLSSPSAAPAATEKRKALEPVSLKVASAYPTIVLYPSVYPHNLSEIYGPATTETVRSTDLPAGYPAVEPYQHVYPYNLKRMYPTMKLAKDIEVSVEVVEVTSKERETVSLRLPAHYPGIYLYEPGYPWNLESIYPTARSVESDDECQDPTAYPHSLRYIYSPSPKKAVVVVNVASQYPVMEIYAPVYPWNLEHIYPAVKPGKTTTPRGATGIVVALSANYPHIELYTSVYPHSLQSIYPPVKPVRTAVPGDVTGIVVALPTKYPRIELYAPVYPHSLRFIYPTLATLTAAPIPRASKPTTPAPRTSKPHLKNHSHHAKSSSGARLPPPPVPPLPQNVEVLRPINPTSRRQLSGERIAMSLPVRLPTFYPTICPYPAAYPHFDLYPRRAVAPVLEQASVASIRLPSVYPTLNIYRAVYPFLELYPQAAASKLATPSIDNTATKVASVAAKGYLPRKQPKRTHEELHRMVFESMLVVNEPAPADLNGFLLRKQPKRTHEELHRMVFGDSPEKSTSSQEETTPALKEAVVDQDGATFVLTAPPPAPQVSTPPRTSRRLPPVPPPQIPLPPVPAPPAVPVAQNTSIPNVAPVPSPVPSPSPSPRSRVRSGTVSARPPLPSPPTTALPPAPVSTPAAPPVVVSALSPVASSPTVRRLPALPEDGSASPSTRRPMSVRVGLPSSPAAGRRMSIVQPPMSRSTSFSPLAAVPEPSVLAPALVSPPLIPTVSPVSPFRPLPPQPLTVSPERSPPPPADLQRSNSASLRPSSLAPITEGASDISRRKSLPPRPLPRARRDSAAVASSGLVAGLASRYNGSNLGTVDEQSPVSPPRPPLPPVPTNRPPVSKLDRSKYPFA
ncbi:hypothetical protein EIP86_000320 [Pleurotus ostreatoroseus]|nr:hypothetical protein EIP86_000320 [Pleurotus ostreatoroseus]